MEKVFTPARRKLIYHVASAALLILAMHGLITAEEAETYMQAVILLLTGAVPELAAANVTED